MDKRAFRYVRGVVGILIIIGSSLLILEDGWRILNSILLLGGIAVIIELIYQAYSGSGKQRS
jgi:hypothetical protein